MVKSRLIICSIILVLLVTGTIFISYNLQNPPSSPSRILQPSTQTDPSLQPFPTHEVEISLKIPKTTPNDANIIFAAVSFNNEPWVQITLQRESDKATGTVQLPTNTFFITLIRLNSVMEKRLCFV